MKKILTTLPIIILLLALFFGAFAIQQYFSYLGPVLADKERVRVEEERLLLEKERLNLTHLATEERLRREATTNLYSWFGIIAIVGGFGFVLYFIWKGYDQRKESWARPVDGMFALQTLKNVGREWSVNHNKSVTGMMSVDKSGEVSEAEISKSFGPDRQLAHAALTQRTNTAVAMANSPSGKYVAPWKALSGVWDRLPKVGQVVQDDDDEEEEREPFVIMSLSEAIEQSKDGKWIIGQSEIDGALSIVDIRSVVHLGLIGAPGVGKTSSTGLLLAFYAVRDGMQVVCLDAKGGEDWTQYDKFFDVQETNAEVFPAQLGAITAEYNRRKSLLKANKWMDISQSNGTVQPMLVILEEFGALMENISQHDKTMYGRIEIALSTVMRLSRAVGIHFVIIDQTTSGWPQVVINIIKLYIAYKLSGSSAHSVKLYYLSKLAEQGEFCTTSAQDNKFKAWHTGRQLDLKRIAVRDWQLLPTITVQNDTDLITDLVTDFSRTTKDVEKIAEVNSKEEKTSREYHTIHTVTDEEIIEAYNVHGSLNKTCIALFGIGKSGGNYNKRIKPVLVGKGLVDEEA